MGVWVGGHTWKMTHPQAMEFFGVQKYFLLIVQHNIIEFQKHKGSGHPKEITFTVVIKMINSLLMVKGGEGVSFHTNLFSKTEKSHRNKANVTSSCNPFMRLIVSSNVTSSCNPLMELIASANVRSWCNTVPRVIASAATMSLVLGDSMSKVMMCTTFVQHLPLFLHTRIIPNYLMN